MTPINRSRPIKTHALTAANALWTNQFDNLDNMDAHYSSTGPEVWFQTEGKVDAFVSSCGTGGTIAGTSRYLKERHADKAVLCYLASPLGSGVVLERTPSGQLKNRLKTAAEKEMYARHLFFGSSMLLSTPSAEKRVLSLRESRLVACMETWIKPS